MGSRPQTEQTLKQKTAKGFFWGGLNSILFQLLSLSVGILLARSYLSQSDYGIMAVLVFFSSVSLLIQDSGFSIALINKKNAGKEDFNAVFWFSALTGILLYIILFLISPFAARYLNMPELKETMRVMMLCIVFNGFSATHNTVLVKNLMMKQKTIIDTSSFALASLLGLVLAMNGAGYWSLVIQNGMGSLFYLILRWYYSPFRPSLHFSFSPLKSILPFSVKLFITSFFTTVNNNIFSLLLSKYFNKTVTGYYYEGYKWVNYAYFFIWNMINNVSQSVLAKVADEEERNVKIFRKMIRFTAFLALPCMLGLALISKELILITVTDKWILSVPYMQLFCIWGAYMPLNNLYANLVVSRGRSTVYMFSVISLGITQMGSAFLVIHLFHDIMLMLIVYLSVGMIWFFVWNGIVYKLFRVPVFTVIFKDIFPFFIATLFSIGAAWFVSALFTDVYAVCGTKIGVAIMVYIAFMRITRCQIFKESVQFIISSLPFVHRKK